MNNVEVVMRRWAHRSLAYYAKKYGMTTQWKGPNIVGFDKTTKQWVVLFRGEMQ